MPQTLDDVAELALGFPGAVERPRHGNRTWYAGEKAFAWERPFSKADLRRFGDETPPSGTIIALRVADLADKDAALAANPKAFFDIPHFDGYAAILVQLSRVNKRALERALRAAWTACAPQAKSKRR